MKPIAVFVLVAVFSVATVAATAKVTTAPQSDSDRVVQGVAGPEVQPLKKTAQVTHPSKQELKKAKIKPKPGLNDPN